MGGVNTQGIQVQDYPRVIPAINLALSELYKRFDLKRSEVVVQQYDQITMYKLDSRFAVTNVNSNEPIKYIEDSQYFPFQDDVLKIERVFNEEGEQLYLNQENAYTTPESGLGSEFYGSDKYWSVHIPSYNVVQVPYPDSANQMIITYRAKHPTISSTITDPSIVNVDLPESLLEALLLYIGSRVNINRGTELSLAEGQLQMAKFEASISKITEMGIINSDDTENSKLDSRGWV